MTISLLRALVALLAIVGAIVIPTTPAHAQPLTITLVRDTGNLQVTDSAGRWQYDGGMALLNGAPVGRYARTIRLIVGNNAPHDIAMLTIALYLSSGNPPENCTAQGVRNTVTGADSGGVSACSAGLAAEVGRTFSSADGVTFTLH